MIPPKLLISPFSTSLPEDSKLIVNLVNLVKGISGSWIKISFIYQSPEKWFTSFTWFTAH